jgi:hypothetical protein
VALSSQVSVSVLGKLSSTPDLAKLEANIAVQQAVSFANGVLAGQADRVWADTMTIAASGTNDIDLAGSLLDPAGGPFVLARVKALVVVARAANTNNVVVGAAAALPWTGLLGATHTLTLRPGAFVAVGAGSADLAGYVVTAGSADVLRFANSGAGSSVVADVAIIGCSS